MVRVRALAEPHHLGVDLRAAAPGVLPLLEDQHARAVAYHESVAVLVERAAGGLRAVVALGEPFHVPEAPDPERRDGGFPPPPDHDARPIVADPPQPIPPP